MKKTLWRSGLKAALLLAMCFLFLVIDWLPTAKELNRLKRSESDYMKKNRDFNSLMGVFAFPDGAEAAAIAQAENALRLSVPREENDASWLDRVRVFLRRQASLDRVDQAVLVAPAASGAGPCARFNLATAPAGREFLPWLADSCREFDHRRAATAGRGFPWHPALKNAGFPGCGQLADRFFAVVVSARPAALLNFVNHCSWFNGRLEMVYLRLGQAGRRPLALIVCRGTYRVFGATAWPASVQAEKSAETQLIDPDSDLLWQRIAPGTVFPWGKKELALTVGLDRK